MPFAVPPNPSISRQNKVACNDCNLLQICIPSGMPPADVDQLSKVVRRNRRLNKGEEIYLAGERFTGVFALKAGTAKLVRADASGHESIIAVLLPGELQGFDGLATGRYLCSLIALETISYCELAVHDLEALSLKIPAVQQVLLQRTGEQFDQCIERIAMSQSPAEQRLAAFLLDLSQRYRQRGFSAEQFHLSLTRQEIGNHLGLALETVSRLLGKFEAADHIRVRGRLIHILDATGLRRVMARDSARPYRKSAVV